ncbi:MAG: hypothetical protein PVF45_12970 [Anaerolineae bacterium]|jgi:hypothetical protein
MLKRSFNPLQMVAWVGAAVVLIVVAVWILRAPDPQPQAGMTIQITPAQARTTRWPATQVVEVTPSLRASTVTPTPPPTPTPPATQTPTARPTRELVRSYFRTKEEIMADVDLNCDGLEERLLKVNSYTGNPADDNPAPLGIVGVILQVPAQKGHRNTWEHLCEFVGRYSGPNCYRVEIKLLATDSCEQFVTFGGYFDGVGRLMVFRWDGRDMSVVLDALADDYASTQDPFILTAINRECTTPTKCVERRTNYVWNGTELVLEESGAKTAHDDA